MCHAYCLICHRIYTTTCTCVDTYYYRNRQVCNFLKRIDLLSKTLDINDIINWSRRRMDLIELSWRAFDSLIEKKVDPPFRCPCGSDEIHLYRRDGDFICANCPLVRRDDIVLEELNKYDKKTYDGRSFQVLGYNKVDHYMEVDRQRQGYGGYVDPYVIQRVDEVYKASNTPITINNTIEILEQLRDLEDKNYSRYYEHASQITSRINHKDSIWLNETMSERIKTMHRHALVAWENCPAEIKKKRRSFPNVQVFMKRCCIYQRTIDKNPERQALYDAIIPTLKEFVTPSTAASMNTIWRFFGRWCNWEGAEISCVDINPLYGLAKERQRKKHERKKIASLLGVGNLRSQEITNYCRFSSFF